MSSYFFLILAREKHKKHVEKSRDNVQAKSDPECLECIKDGKVHQYLEKMNEDVLIKKYPSGSCTINATQDIKGVGEIEML